MPRLLKLDTQRRLTACQATLTLAISLLSRPRTVAYEQGQADGAVEVGLIGVAADLAVSACLYEVFGNEGIVRKDSGFFLTASEADKGRYRTFHEGLIRGASQGFGRKFKGIAPASA